MNETDIRNLIERWVEARNGTDVDVFRQFYADDVVMYQAPMKKSLTGIEHVIARLEDLNTMGPDVRMTTRSLYVDGDTAILEFNIVGTQTGRFLDYEPTGRMMDIDSCLVFKVENGKITRHTTYLDTASILRALGLIEVKGTRAEAA